MWLENLKDLRERSGKSYKQLSDATKIPESTIKRIFAGTTDDPYISTISKIVTALGGSLDSVLSDTNAVIAPVSVVEVKEEAEAIKAENDVVAAKNDMLEAKVSALTMENELLKREIQHKEELLAVHNYYISLNKNRAE